MKGKKTGGRVKGTPNKPNPIKENLKAQSAAYFSPSIPADPETAALLGIDEGELISRFAIDCAAMEPAARAAIHERLLRYHTPQMQSVSADVSHSAAGALAERLARLAADNDG